MGLVVGALSAAVLLLGMVVGLPAFLSLVLALLASVILTGALHEDGLADFCDGLGVHGPARIIAVMRDSQIGTFGVLGLSFGLALKGAALYELVQLGQGVAGLIIMHVAARGAVGPLVLLPLADKAGLAHDVLEGGQDLQARGAVFSTHFAARLVPVVLSLLISFLLVAWFVGPLIAFGVLLAGVFASLMIGLIAGLRLGGVTGDVFGAAEQVSELAVLVALLLFFL